MNLPIIDGKIAQICFVVDDVEAAVMHWVNTLGAGPFFVQNGFSGLPITYRGTPSFLEMDVALGQAGALQIELIKPRGTAPSVFTDMYPQGGSGFHHVALFVDDFDAQLETFLADGHSIGTLGAMMESRFAYVDTRSTVGFFTEIYEDTDFMRGLHRLVANAAKDWDGTHPIRSLADISN